MRKLFFDNDDFINAAPAFIKPYLQDNKWLKKRLKMAFDYYRNYDGYSPLKTIDSIYEIYCNKDYLTAHRLLFLSVRYQAQTYLPKEAYTMLNKMDRLLWPFEFTCQEVV
jgi:hypothetical protein